MSKSISLALALAAALALPIAANATPNDGSGSGDGQMNKETCEALGGTYSPATILQSLTYCYYPDGGVTTCTSWACEYTPPRAVMMTPATPAAPSAIMMQR